MAHSSLSDAKRRKDDEYYTLLSDVDEELSHHASQLAGRSVYLPCDDPSTSQIWAWLAGRFTELGLSRLVSTFLGSTDRPAMMTSVGLVDGKPVLSQTSLRGDGDFRSEECLSILDTCDIAITNPPFSLFKVLVAMLLARGKDFILLGNKNAVALREVFPRIMAGQISIGHNIPREFLLPDGTTTKRVSGICRWYTTLPVDKHPEPLELTEEFDATRYPRYDNYDAVEVSRTSKIPRDYPGVMGVPLTYIDKHCPSQFEILWIACGNAYSTMPPDIREELRFDPTVDCGGGLGSCVLHGKAKYTRLFIRRVDSAA